MAQRHAQGALATCGATPQEGGGQTQRDGHDGRCQVLLVAVLVQRQARAGGVAVDQAGVGHESGKAGLLRCGMCQLREVRRQGGPGLAGQRVQRSVAVTAPIAHPRQRPAACGGYRHRLASRGLHVAPRRLAHHLPHFLQQLGCLCQREAAQQHGLHAQRQRGWLRGVVGKQVVGGYRWHARSVSQKGPQRLTIQRNVLLIKEQSIDRRSSPPGISLVYFCDCARCRRLPIVAPGDNATTP